MTLLHPSVRFMRVGIALVTVWCLGCGAFEPLVAGLTRTESIGMNCGSEEIAGSAATGSVPSEHALTVKALEQRESGNYSCGCDSCYSTSPVTISIALASLSAPEAIPATPAFPESVSRAPLHPPPQLVS